MTVRGMVQIGSRDGVVVFASNGPRRPRCRLLWEKHQPPKLAPSNKNAYDTIGFLAGAVGFGCNDSLVRSNCWREDVSIRVPIDADGGSSGGATILVLDPPQAVLSDYVSARAGYPVSPVTSVSAFLMNE